MLWAWRYLALKVLLVQGKDKMREVGVRRKEGNGRTLLFKEQDYLNSDYHELDTLLRKEMIMLTMKYRKYILNSISNDFF